MVKSDNWVGQNISLKKRLKDTLGICLLKQKEITC